MWPVIDSFVVDKANFLEAYKIHEESGKIGLTGESDCTEFTNGMKDKKILSHRLPGNQPESAVHQCYIRWRLECS